METPFLSRKQFNKFRRVLPLPRARQRIDDRVVISGIIYVLKNNIPWRHLPKIYGKWRTVYSRFRRWCRQGIFQKIFTHFSSKLKKRCIAMLDSTYIKAHRTACSLASDGKPRLLGRSRGGMTTKIHLLCTAGGQPMDFMVTGGEVADIKIAPELVSRNKMKAFLADKAYHSLTLRKQLAERRIKICIPPKSNTKTPVEFDKTLYRKRHKIENLFSRLKDWRGIAFRTHRNASHFQGCVALALLSLFL